MNYRRVSMGLLLVGLLAACFSEKVEDRFKRGIGLLFENRYEEAESLYLAIASELKSSSLPDALRLQARALYQAAQIEHLYLNQPRRAVARFHEALKVDPEAPFAFDAQREIVTIYQERLMDYRAAAEELERLVNMFPAREDISEYQYRMAQCYFWLRDFNQARAEAEAVVRKKDPGMITALARLLIANSFSAEGRYQEAIEAYQTLINANPDPELRARAQFELGVSYHELGDIPKAEKALLEALKKHPRPDLVQAQLSNLRERFTDLDPSKRSGKAGSGEKRYQALKPMPATTGTVRTPKSPALTGPSQKPAATPSSAPVVSTPVSTHEPPAPTQPTAPTQPPAPTPIKQEKPETVNGSEKQPPSEKILKTSVPESSPAAAATSQTSGQ